MLEDSENPERKRRKPKVKPTPEELKDAYDKGYAAGASDMERRIWQTQMLLMTTGGNG
jgi:hypothetical protein